jgi:hypothetical protein
MQTGKNNVDNALQSLTNIEARRHQTDAAFKAITKVEVAARLKKTERLKAARIQSSTIEPS